MLSRFNSNAHTLPYEIKTYNGSWKHTNPIYSKNFEARHSVLIYDWR